MWWGHRVSASRCYDDSQWVSASWCYDDSKSVLLDVMMTVSQCISMLWGHWVSASWCYDDSELVLHDTKIMTSIRYLTDNTSILDTEPRWKHIISGKEMNNGPARSQYCFTFSSLVLSCFSSKLRQWINSTDQRIVLWLRRINIGLYNTPQSEYNSLIGI